MDARVVVATNRDLARQVEAGAFRRDLYARLALWEIRVPPLRARRADVLGWLERLRARWCLERGLPPAPVELEVEAAEALLLHCWPNNLRDMERLVHALGDRPGPHAHVEVVAAIGPPSPVGEEGRTAASEAPARRPPPSPEELQAALDRYEGSVRAVARHFGRDRRQIYRWIDAHGLQRPAGDREGEP